MIYIFICIILLIFLNSILFFLNFFLIFLNYFFLPHHHCLYWKKIQEIESSWKNLVECSQENNIQLLYNNVDVNRKEDRHELASLKELSQHGCLIFMSARLYTRQFYHWLLHFQMECREKVVFFGSIVAFCLFLHWLEGLSSWLLHCKVGCWRYWHHFISTFLWHSSF